MDWYEWGDEAFAAAKLTDRPILLSVGYSACHWCHVMAHESFEDPDTAALMNDLFISIKVDREERPDVDSIYMEAVQTMTGRGGWPMTVFLTPDRTPFYAGTYFPPDDRQGMPSFTKVMSAVSDAWQKRREDVVSQADKLADALNRPAQPSTGLPGKTEMETAYVQLRQGFDSESGGFGGAPKFPQEPVLDWLLRIADEPWAPDARWMAAHTFSQMAAGGIYDHVGGGFARYSVDERWLIPHFEKMLYNNAQLARLYLRAWQVLGIERFRTVAEETLGYMLRDLRHPDGGFFSAEDADSEGVEGKFYVWSKAEFDEVAGPSAEVAGAFFGVTSEGNFEGANHLFITDPTADPPPEIDELRQRLLERRSSRIRPGLDDKAVASWNGLALRAFAEAGAVLDEPRYLDAARAIARFIGESLTRSDGRLMRSWRQGQTSVPGFLDDYASCAVGMFVLYQATGETAWYDRALVLVNQLLDLFADPAGGFFSTGRDSEQLITRPKDQMDNPAPSGSSLAAEALLLASLYTGEVRYRDVSEATVRASGEMVSAYPTAVGHLLGVVHALHKPPKELAIVGPDAQTLARVAWEEYRPHIALAFSTDGKSDVPLLAERFVEGKTLAYVCEGFVCQKPVESPQELRALL